MLLVQKQISITLPTQERVRKLIYINLSTVLIVNYTSLTIYDMKQNKQIWNCLVNQWKQQNVKILQAVYHPLLRKLYILLGLSDTDKHRNWQLVSINLSNNSLPITPNTLTSFIKSPTRYQQMQLQPQMIVFPKSQYFVLLRQFYNDSMVVIFKDNKYIGQFFINQQNMMEFDKVCKLVSFRAIFNGPIIWEEFDIRGTFIKEHKVDKKWRNFVTIQTNKSGVIVAVKTVYLKFDSQLQIPPYNLQYEQKEQTKKLPTYSLIAINWRNKCISYLIHNSNTNQIMSQISTNNLTNSIILSYFAINQMGNKICTLQRRGKQTVIVYERFLNKNKSTQVFLPINGQMEEWQSFIFDQNQFVVLNYTQPAENQATIVCRLYRNMYKKQAIIHLAKLANFQESLFELITQMYLQSN